MWQESLDDGRLECTLCPRRCRLREGQRGFCYVRQRQGQQIVLTTHGRSSGFCLDPVEKKPLNHFLPGSAVLSFGTAGCNLGCKFCQNWSISTSREWDTVSSTGEPDAIAKAAASWGAESVAMTYNDPVIFAEYAVDTARACRERGLKTIAVTSAYIEAHAREAFFSAFDAVNVDLKAFTPEFYRRLTGARLDVVLDNLAWLAEQDIWTELTTLIIPGKNDGDEEITAMAEWVLNNMGPDVPHHFSAFHPSHKMMDTPPTPASTLVRARSLAMDAGEHFVYTGNVHSRDGDTTFCPGCGSAVIVRDWYDILEYSLDASGCCESCGQSIPGVFDPLGAGSFGRQRIPMRVER